MDGEILLAAFREKSKFAEFLVMLIKQMHNDTAPGARFLCAFTLTPLDKKPGVRLTAVGGDVLKGWPGNA